MDSSASKDARKYCVFDVEYVGPDESYEGSAAPAAVPEGEKSSLDEAPEVLLEVCNQMRIAGNLSFKIGGFMEAATLYQEAIGYLGQTDHPLFIKLHNNAAASFLNAGNFPKLHLSVTRSDSFDAQTLPGNQKVEGQVGQVFAVHGSAPGAMAFPFQRHQFVVNP